jgi:hypothetical protein
VERRIRRMKQAVGKDPAARPGNRKGPPCRHC